MTKTFRTPSVDDHRRFLIGFSFSGSLAPGPSECVARAYRDFSRTAAGIGSDSGAEVRKANAHRVVEQLVAKALAVDWNQVSFDSWHLSACTGLVSLYAGAGFPQFSVGQAQKWLNMSLKYILSLAQAGIYSIQQPTNLWSVAHAPLDDFILEVTGAYQQIPSCRPWSRMRDYSTYMSVQEWIRNQFPKASSLDVEFHLYNEEAARRRVAGQSRLLS